MQYKPILLVHKSFHINGGMGDHFYGPFRMIFILFLFYYLSLNYLKQINELGLNYYYYLINIIEF